MPVASNLNFRAQVKNQAIANRVKIGIGTNGQIEVYNHSGTVNVDVDVDGYYSGAGGSGSYYVPITPVRVADNLHDQLGRYRDAYRGEHLGELPPRHRHQWDPHQRGCRGGQLHGHPWRRQWLPHHLSWSVHHDEPCRL
jgi:hypothetical protein